MYIVFYAAVGILLMGFMSLFYIRSDRRRSYINTVVSVMLFFLLLFEILSGLFGIHQTGAFGSSNFPEDWINRGWFGWMLLGLIIIGLFSPIWIVGFSRDSRTPPPEG
jgi:hypothetical protein